MEDNQELLFGDDSGTDDDEPHEPAANGAPAPLIQRELTALDVITQRVNMQSTYNMRMARLKDAIRTEEDGHRNKLSRAKERHRVEIEAKNLELKQVKEQARALASLAFASDVKLVSSDGVVIPACKATLVANSPVFKEMFAEHNAELAHQQSGELKFDVSAAVLQYVVGSMYSPSFASAPSTGVRLDACELATSWELVEVFKSCVSALSGESGGEAAAVLAVADRHLGAEDPKSPFTSGWRELRDDAARALAHSMPHGAAHPAFKTLSLAAILETACHVKGGEFVECLAPALPLDGEPVFGPFTKPMTWLAPPFIDAALGFSQFRIRLQRNDDQSSLFVFTNRTADKQADVPESSRTFEAHCRLSRGEDTTHRFVSTTFGPACGGPTPLNGVRNFLPAHQLPDQVPTFFGARVATSHQQRKVELLNLWLLATERVTAPLAPAQLLLCLRACACGFNPADADVDTLLPQLGKRGLLGTGGSKEELQTRLQDALFAELPMKRGSALGKVCRALAGLIARRCAACAKDGSLFELDAASFSMVLAHDDLAVQSESIVLEQLSW